MRPVFKLPTSFLDGRITRMVSPKLVQIKTEDELVLPGLFYEVRGGKKVAIRLHGNGSTSVFYDDDLREEQANALNRKGISFMPFNNRGAHYIKKLHHRSGKSEVYSRFGMAYEKIKDCTKDIDAAIKFLEKLGYKEFYLIGESTGANKICVYHYYKPKNKVSKYILISGVDDVGIYYKQLGKEKFHKLLKESKSKALGKGKGKLIEEILPDEIFSYQAFYDTINPDGDYNVFPTLEVSSSIKLSKKPLFRHFNSLNKPTLVIHGEKDEHNFGKTKELVNAMRKLKPEFDYRIIKDADHAILNNQKEVARIISKWLAN